MTLGELIDLFRTTVLDLRAPFLWEDSEIIEFANDAHMEAARRARLLTDARTPEICRVTISASSPWVTIDKRIIFTRRVLVAGQTKPLTKMLQWEMDQQRPGWESAAASMPLVYIPNLSANALRLYPPSSAATTAQLTVVREPMRPMTDLSDVPEIAARYHRGLLNWMLHRAYAKPDVDTQNLAASIQYEADFAMEFGKKSSAIDEEWIDTNYGADAFEGLF